MERNRLYLFLERMRQRANDSDRHTPGITVEDAGRAISTLSEGRVSAQEAATALRQVVSRMDVFYVPSAPPRPVVCNGCRYYHGLHGINCAVYPMGPEGEGCKDHAD